MDRGGSGRRLPTAEAMKPIPWTVENCRAFAPALDRNPYGALESPGEVLTGSYLYQFDHRAQSALLAVRPLQLSHGVRLEVVGMVSEGQRFQAAALDRVMTEIAFAHGADQLAMMTKHAGLVRACVRHGWADSGRILTKNTRAFQ